MGYCVRTYILCETLLFNMKSKNRVLIIPIMGGLGNQLFQYAAGLYLRKYYGIVPKFLLGRCKVRTVVPVRSCLIGELVGEDEDSKIGWLYFIIIDLLSKVKSSILVEEKGADDFPFTRVTKSTKAITGYFQKQNYVEAVAGEIFRSMSDSSSFGKLLSAKTVNNIAVHIRLGDYASNRGVRRSMGLSAMSYYVNGVKSLQATYKYDNIVIYSDEPERAHAEFVNAFGATIVPIVFSKNKSELEDLMEMSSCKGLVISNSTFSWWAGWLASNLRKCTVIAPRPWRAKPTIADKSLLLESWVVVDREMIS